MPRFCFPRLGRKVDGMLGRAGWRAQKEGGCVPRAAEAPTKRSRSEVARPRLGRTPPRRRGQTDPLRVRGPGGALEVPTRPRQAFFSSLAGLLPSCPSPPPNK